MHDGKKQQNAPSEDSQNALSEEDSFDFDESDEFDPALPDSDIMEDDFTEEESWDEFADESEQTGKGAKAQDTPLKERTYLQKNFNVIVISVVAVLVVGWLLVKLSAPPASQAPAPVDNTAAQNSDGTPQEREEEPEEKTEKPQGFLANPEFLDIGAPESASVPELVSLQETVPMPSPIAPELEPLPEEESFAEKEPDFSAQPIAQPVHSAVDMPEEVPEEPFLMQDTAAAPQAAPQNFAREEEIETLRTRIDELGDELSQNRTDLNKKIENLTEMVAILTEKIDESKNLMEKGEENKKIKPQEQKKLAINPPIPEKKADLPPQKDFSSQKTANIPTRTYPTWQLRAAQPGKALISQTGKAEFRTIQLGDTLPGLGRVLSITQKNGRWVVRGTESSIYQ